MNEVKQIIEDLEKMSNGYEVSNGLYYIPKTTLDHYIEKLEASQFQTSSEGVEGLSPISLAEAWEGSYLASQYPVDNGTLQNIIHFVLCVIENKRNQAEREKAAPSPSPLRAEEKINTESVLKEWYKIADGLYLSYQDRDEALVNFVLDHIKQSVTSTP